MIGIPTPTNQHYRFQHRKTICLATAALALLFLLLAACISRTAGSSPPAVTPTPTIQPQTAAPTATFHPTFKADRDETIDRTAQPSPELPDEKTLPTLNTPVAGEVPPELLESLLADLAERLGIPIDQITVLHSQAVEWSDGSLGCPQPGKVYIQVLTLGFRVVLAAQDQLYDYHTDTRAEFILCNPNGVIADPPPLLPILPGNKSPECKWPPCN